MDERQYQALSRQLKDETVEDKLNVYAGYDMHTGQICDMPEVDLHQANGKMESLEYRLDAVEKAVLLWKIDDYCQQQIDQTLAQHSAQLMTEASTSQQRHSQSAAMEVSL